MSAYDWTIQKLNGQYWVYFMSQPRKGFATHKQALRYIRLERQAAGEI